MAIVGSRHFSDPLRVTDYVKSVLRNYRLYRLFYAAPSPDATSAGSPPNAPFDMIAMTSPARALAIR